MYQVNPADNNRNYKADFFHEMLHKTGITNDKSVDSLVQDCFGTKKVSTVDDKMTMKPWLLTSELEKSQRTVEKKEGIVVNLPANSEVSQTTIANVASEGNKSLDNNFSMDNEPQYESLSKASKATFKSFDPIMKAAYEAAVPTAFAQNSLGAASTGTPTSVAATASAALPTVKAASGTSRMIASAGSSASSVTAGAVYDVSSLPESVTASDKGELGNGLAVKAAAVNVKEGLARSPSSISGRSGEETASSGGSASNLNSGSLGYVPMTDRPDLRNNVPHLKTEEDFLKTLTSGKYDEIKARLTDPKNQQILEDKRIQYIARDRTLGSKKPVMILKDLGNKFSIVRVTVE
jgi:hypothetical protein